MDQSRLYRVTSLLHRTITALLALALPSPVARPVLNLLGHRISRGSRIGFSWVACRFIALARGARIGHLNFAAIDRLILREEAYVGRGNVFRGPFDVVMGPRSGIGNSNRLLRARRGISHGPAHLVLGQLAKITVAHRIDCTRSVHLGAFSTLAGAGSQVWTHGYVHDTAGPGRYRVDGQVVIENNVYVGSACLISMGVRIVGGVIIGGGTSISRSLLERGMYVSAPARIIPRPDEPDERSDLTRVNDATLCETVFVKRRP